MTDAAVRFMFDDSSSTGKEGPSGDAPNLVAMTLSRRRFLQSGLVTAAGVAVARPLGALTGPLGLSATVSRQSRLFAGTVLAHADMHNHSLQSDGAGDPAKAFGSMRAAGLDVAALTDHATLAWGLPQSVCAGNKDCQSLLGIEEASWARTKALANVANAEGSFVAIRGFEWSSPTIGHMNVWFSERWMDPLHTAGAGTGEGAAQFAHDEANVPRGPMQDLDAIVRAAPTTGIGMAPFYEWLKADSSTPVLGGGADGLASFNPPGREPGRFSNFRALLPKPPNIVAIEMFNRAEDYIFEGTDSIAQSPLNECLNAGWRVGITGVTDEHGTDWGVPIGKGRTGIWLTELTRASVADALRARRVFATRERGLRVDASANGTRMGGELAHDAGPITFAIDVEKDGWAGKELMVQVLRKGVWMPAVQHNELVVVPAATDPVITFTVPVFREDGDWVVLRITDPNATPDGRADATWATYGRAVAYTSPFFLNAERASL